MENNKKIKTVFLGTPDFALPSLEALMEDGYFEVLAVVTQPDKKIGRRQLVRKPAVKQYAEDKNIKVFQPENINKDYAYLEEIKPDLIVVSAFGQILNKAILDIPKYGSINIHASLLPKYRGASCIQAALLNQDSETGISIIKMDSGLDTGPIIYQEKIEIRPDDNAGSLFERLSGLSKKILPMVLKKYINKELSPIEQDHEKSSYVGLIKKEDGLIDPSSTVNKAFAQYRAMTPWPGLYMVVDNTSIKLLELEIADSRNDHSPGLHKENNNLYLQLKDGRLKIKKVQAAGRKALSSGEFIHGYGKYLNN